MPYQIPLNWTGRVEPSAASHQLSERETGLSKPVSLDGRTLGLIGAEETSQSAAQLTEHAAEDLLKDGEDLLEEAQKRFKKIHGLQVSVFASSEAP